MAVHKTRLLLFLAVAAWPVVDGVKISLAAHQNGQLTQLIAIHAVFFLERRDKKGD